MTISLHSIGATPLEFAAATTSAVPYPASISAGDLLLLTGSASAAGLYTNPSWTVVPVTGVSGLTTANFSCTGSTASPDLFIAYTIATGAESGTLTVTHPNSANIDQITAWSGVDNVTPMDVTAQAVDLGAATSTVITGLTIATAGAALIYAAATNNAAANASPATGPGTFTELSDRVSGTRSAATGYLLGLGTGATGNVTVSWGATSARSIGVLLALRPGTGGGGDANPMRPGLPL